MKANGMLRDQLQDHVQTAAQHALDNYNVTGAAQGSFDERFSAQMENGEGIVGYQYLHGTNRDVGDFGFKGTTEVRPRGDGTYEVTVNSGYTWNDRIDPNPQYETDNKKSLLAEIFTLGQADPYDIHINWHAPVKVVLDANGNVISGSGYLYD